MTDDTGVLRGFEVSNLWLKPRAIGRILRAGGAEVLRDQQVPRDDRDVRLRFRFRSHNFLVIEPFGDNSRYLVAPEAPSLTAAIDVQALHDVFSSYRPTPAAVIRSLIGA